MDTFGILGFIFGLLGFMAFLSESDLKKRIKRLEDELSQIKGTSYSVSKESLGKIAYGYIGKQVDISFKEDCWDPDVLTYGNTKGKNVIIDADDNWILVEITTPKKVLLRIFRLDSIDGLTAVN